MMRMWMVDVGVLCDRHLLGEHGELHKHLHNWRKRHRIDGRIAVNSIEPGSYKSRHDALEVEMARRGMKPNSPIEQPDFSYLPEVQRGIKVDVVAAMALLVERCERCAVRKLVS
jgi:hypothetical protein